MSASDLPDASLLLALLFAPRSTRHRIMRETMTRRIIIGLICLGAVLALPAAIVGFINGHDVDQHIVYTRHFLNQFWAGDWYPRWLTDTNAGLGSPVFYIYPPLPYFVAAPFHPLSWLTGDHWLPLSISAALAIIGSGIAFFFWCRDLLAPRAALLGAVAYMIFPYHLLVDLYLRYALAELWAFVWMPLVLLFSRRAAVGDLRAVALLAIATGLLLYSHLLTTMLFAPLPVLYAWLNAAGRSRVLAIMYVGGGMALGAALAALYVVPAMAVRQYVPLNEAISTIEDVFLFKSARMQTEPYQGLWTILSRFTILSIGVALAAFFLAIQDEAASQRRESVLWLSVVLFTVFMMSPLSAPIWHALPPLQMVSFPWRYGSIVVLACAALLALAVNAVFDGRRAITAPQRALAIFAVVAFSVPLFDTARAVYWSAMRPRDLRQLEQLSMVTPAFRTRWVPAYTEQSLQDLKRQIGTARFVSGTGAVAVMAADWAQMTLSINATESATLAVGQFYYPSWRASTIDGLPLTTRPGPVDGLLWIDVPAGFHTVTVDRSLLREEILGLLLTACGIVCTVGLLVAGRQPANDPPPLVATPT